jgi:hypothetical protein
MKNKNLYLLLEIVNNNGDIRKLLREGLNYKKIGELTADAISKGYLIFEQEKLKLSFEGVNLIADLAQKYKKINKEEWIEPETKSKIAHIEKDFIFLPNRNELSF